MKDLWYDCEENGRRYVYESTRVVLVNYDYDAGRDDPIIDSEYECEGVVIGPSNDASYPIQVEWDNGHSNQYKGSDLEIIGQIPIKPSMDKDNPNRSFRAHKQKLISADMVQDSANMMDEVKAIGKIRKATGMGTSEASHLYRKYDGDVDAAITYYNLEHGSVARSVARELREAETRGQEVVLDEMSSEEFDEAQSVDNIANSLSPSTMATDGSSVVLAKGGVLLEDSEAFIEAGRLERLQRYTNAVSQDSDPDPVRGYGTLEEIRANTEIPGGCEPISHEEIGRRVSNRNPCGEVLAPEPTNSVKQQRSKKKNLDTMKWTFRPIR